MEIDNSTAKSKDEQRPIAWGPVAAVIVTVVIYFVSQFAAGLLLFIYPALQHWNKAQINHWLDTSVVAQFILIILAEGITLYLLWLFLKSRKASFRNLGLKAPAWRDIGYAGLGLLAWLVLYMVVSSLIKNIIPSLNLDQKQELGFSDSTTGVGLVYVFFSLVLLPPFVEEIVARGFLYGGLRSKLSKLSAALITSVMFAAAHLQWGSGAPLLWVAAIDTFILSMILVYLRERTGGLAASMGTHMLKNGLAFMVLFVFK
jgi:membrane protease YdiL (CAAX protease family)